MCPEVVELQYYFCFSLARSRYGSPTWISLTTSSYSVPPSKEPKHPFSLLEVYEDNHTSSVSTPFPTVVVLKGRDALSCHAANQPGSILFLHHVGEEEC
jgi:hypothetical protein